MTKRLQQLSCGLSMTGPPPCMTHSMLTQTYSSNVTIAFFIAGQRTSVDWIRSGETAQQVQQQQSTLLRECSSHFFTPFLEAGRMQPQTQFPPPLSSTTSSFGLTDDNTTISTYSSSHLGTIATSQTSTMPTTSMNNLSRSCSTSDDITGNSPNKC